MAETNVVTMEELAERSDGMQRDRSWLRPLVGLGILGVLVWQFGAGTFVDALRRVDPWAVAAAAAIAVVTTACGACRWVLVARALGAELSLRVAVAACYRSQFLNVTLPGGVLGDVDRGVRHGRDGGDLGRGLRSVVWERSAGQLVLVALTTVAVVVAPSPVTSWWRTDEWPLSAVLLVAFAVFLAIVVGVLTARARLRRSGRGAWGRGLATRAFAVTVADVRAVLLGRHTWPGVVGLSILVVAGHVATFVLAARSVGVTAPVTSVVPLALVVLVAMGLPLNVAGWGPREGAAAWAFAALGLGAAAGVATAVVYGVMAFASALPGAALLVGSRRGLPWTRPTLVTEGGVRG